MGSKTELLEGLSSTAGVSQITTAYSTQPSFAHLHCSFAYTETTLAVLKVLGKTSDKNQTFFQQCSYSVAFFFLNE